MQQSLLLRAYHDYERELVRFIGRRVGSPSLAADIAHDIYVKLLRTDDHPPVRDGRAYLFSMAANLATDRLRVEKRRSEILAEADGLAWGRLDELTPERHAFARAELACVEAAVAGLPPRCRRVFYLSRFEGKSQVEIAADLGIGITTVYKDLKRTLDVLIKTRRRFRGEEGDAPDKKGGHKS
jgi:RNA polymerase sigma-70 factor (ECF subfamily)